MRALSAPSLRQQIAEEALTWVGTPWRHRQCCKGAGVDCVRLAEGVAKALGLLAATWTPPRYTPDVHLHSNHGLLERILRGLGCVERPLNAPGLGDLLLFRFGRAVAHLAIVVAPPPVEIVHALKDDARVIHHHLAGDLAHRLCHVYSFPGVRA